MRAAALFEGRRATSILSVGGGSMSGSWKWRSSWMSRWAAGFVVVVIAILGCAQAAPAKKSTAAAPRPFTVMFIASFSGPLYNSKDIKPGARAALKGSGAHLVFCDDKSQAAGGAAC